MKNLLKLGIAIVAMQTFYATTPDDNLKVVRMDGTEIQLTVPNSVMDQIAALDPYAILPPDEYRDVYQLVQLPGNFRLVTDSPDRLTAISVEPEYSIGYKMCWTGFDNVPALFISNKSDSVSIQLCDRDDTIELIEIAGRLLEEARNGTIFESAFLNCITQFLSQVVVTSMQWDRGTQTTTLFLRTNTGESMSYLYNYHTAKPAENLPMSLADLIKQVFIDR